ncbi:phosphatidylserine decarboxylase family protein [Candidatus Woesearchaeota archaeon]|nr:phosphatidylserine decarboxylase family protein [Candidatus Woesearchaeota archaeon]
MWFVLAVVTFVVLAVVLFYFSVFKRDPLRSVPRGNHLVCPTDGRVISIAHTSDRSLQVNKGSFGRITALCSDVAADCTLVSIMMTPLDVHFQRAPIDGVIKKIKHSPGKFKNAVLNRDWAMLENEKNEILIEGAQGRVKVIQIAGILARRIKCFVEEGQVVQQGQKIGFIDIGSQVTLIVPRSRTISVLPGARVLGGETIL